MCLKKENKISEILKRTLQEIVSVIDVDTSIGKPIENSCGDIIMPFSKITFVSLSGGGEFGKLNVFNKGNSPLGVGNGAIVSIKPCGFIVKEKNLNQYKILNVAEGPYEKIIENVSEFVNNIGKNNNEEFNEKS
jgi:uncharacterized spore protein YtfJ